MSAKPTIPYRAAIAVEASMMMVAAVSAIIGSPHTRTAVVEVTTIVAAVDGEVPYSGAPYNRAKEVVGCPQKAVLPVMEDAAQVTQTIAVVVAIDVGRRVNTKEVVEVDLIGIVILLVVEVKLICHFVRQV